MTPVAVALPVVSGVVKVRDYLIDETGALSSIAPVVVAAIIPVAIVAVVWVSPVATILPEGRRR
jgi:hypothetical protein